MWLKSFFGGREALVGRQRDGLGDVVRASGHCVVYVGENGMADWARKLKLRGGRWRHQLELTRCSLCPLWLRQEPQD